VGQELCCRAAIQQLRPIPYPCLGLSTPRASVCTETQEAPAALILRAAEQISTIDAETLTLTLAGEREPLSTQQINVIKVFTGYWLKPNRIFFFPIVAFHSTTQYGKEINISHGTKISSICSFSLNH